MKKTTQSIPSTHQFAVLRERCNLLPTHLVPKLARETGVDKKARSFSPWSHLVRLLYAHLVHAIGLNDVCDGLRLNRGRLVTLRAATPPSRNNLSHASKEREASLAEKLFWAVPFGGLRALSLSKRLAPLQRLNPGFAKGRRGKGLARRFKRVIPGSPTHRPPLVPSAASVVDSTTIQRVASCMDWAEEAEGKREAGGRARKHRRRKAAAKCHMRLDPFGTAQGARCIASRPVSPSSTRPRKTMPGARPNSAPASAEAAEGNSGGRWVGEPQGKS